MTAPAARNPVQRDVLHVSFSQVSNYLLCPERFRLGYVHGITPAHRSGDLVFGSAIHGALALYHEALLHEGKKPSQKSVLADFDNILAAEAAGPVPILWADDEAHDDLIVKGHELLTMYCERFPTGRVLAVEKRFSIPFLGPDGRAAEERLVGVVDVIEEDPDGQVFVTELKTAARRYDRIRLQYDHQVSVYAAARAALGYPEARLRFRVLLKQKKAAIETYDVSRDETQVSEMRHVVGQVLRAIDAAIFYPSRGWQCSTCPYRSRCGE